MNRPPSTTASIYVRSDILPGIESQLRRCKTLAERLGLSVVKKYQDRELPLPSIERRGYQELVSAGRRGDFGLIIVDDIKYLWRSLSDCDQRPSELQALRLDLVTVSGEDTRRLGWALTMQMYIARERDRRASIQSAMDELANEIEVLKKKRP